MVEQTNPALEKTDELAGEEGRSDPLTGASKPGILRPASAPSRPEPVGIDDNGPGVRETEAAFGSAKPSILKLAPIEPRPEPEPKVPDGLAEGKAPKAEPKRGLGALLSRKPKAPDTPPADEKPGGLRLKPQDAPPVGLPSDAVPDRFSEPKPPAVTERAHRWLGRLVRRILVGVLLLVVFLLIPFRWLDTYTVWSELDRALGALRDDSTSENVKELETVAVTLRNSVPVTTVRPTGRFQWLGRIEHDAYTSVGTVLAVTHVLQDHTARGVSEWAFLVKQLGIDEEEGGQKLGGGLTRCDACKEGSSTNRCPECRGGRRCSRCSGRGEVDGSMGQTLKGTARIKARKVMRRCNACAGTGKCPRCHGTGQQTASCAACRGLSYQVDLKALRQAYPSVVGEAIKHVRRAKRMTWLPHALHRLQRAMLLRGEAVTDSVVDRADGMMESLLPQLPGSTPKSSGQGAADVTGEAGLNGGIKFLSGPRTRFTLQNQGDQKTYGPYEFRQGAVVGSERYPYSLQIVDDDTFQLTSPDVATPLGPFELKVGAVVTMPKATFTVMAIMQD